MDKPLISVIIPVYKVEKYLDQCVQSVVGQTYQNLEIILVDDGSPDNCPRMCDRWCEKDHRIRVIHKQNGGLSDARNYGIRESHGEFISFIDSDDWVPPDMVMELYEACDRFHAEMSICQFEIVYQNGEREKSVDTEYPTEVFSAKEALKLLLQEKRISNHAWRKLYRRNILSDETFPVGKFYEDIYAMPQLFLKCRNIVCLNKVLYYYRQNPGGIIKTNSIQSNLDFLEGLQAQYNQIIEALPELKAYAEYSKCRGLYIIWENLEKNRKEKGTDAWKECRKKAQEALLELPVESVPGKRRKIHFKLLKKMPFIADIYFHYFGMR